MNLFIKSVTVVVILSFLYSNFLWANGELSATGFLSHRDCYRQQSSKRIRSASTLRSFNEVGLNANKLAAPPQVAGVGETLARHPEGARLLAGEAVVEGLGIDSISDIVKNMEALTEAGAKCFVSRDADGNIAKYIIGDGALLRKTPADKKVNDKFYRALQLLGIQGKNETVDGEFREYIYVTEKNERFINSILALLSNNNPEWVVKAGKQGLGGKGSRELAREIIKMEDAGISVPEGLKEAVYGVHVKELEALLADNMPEVKDDAEARAIIPPASQTEVPKYDEQGNPKYFDGVTTVVNVQENHPLSDLFRRMIGDRTLRTITDIAPGLSSINDWQDEVLARKIVATVKEGSEHITVYDGLTRRNWERDFEKLNSETKREIEERTQAILKEGYAKDLYEAKMQATFEVVTRRFVEGIEELRLDRAPRFKPFGVAVKFSRTKLGGITLIMVPESADDLVIITRLQDKLEEKTGISNKNFIGHISLGYLVNSLENAEQYRLFRDYINRLNEYVKSVSDDNSLLFEFGDIIASFFYDMESFPEIVSVPWTGQAGGITFDSIVQKIRALQEEGRRIEAEQLLSLPGGSMPADGVPSQFTTIVEGPEAKFLQLPIDNKGTIGVPEITGSATETSADFALSDRDSGAQDLAKLAGILGVSVSQVPETVQVKLQGVLGLIAKKYPGILGAAREIVLVDNLGGLDSAVEPRNDMPGRNVRRSLAIFQNGVIAIDIDAFRNDKVLYDVVLHELWHSILEVVEGNKGVEEAAAIYQSLVYFAEMTPPEQTELITFLKQKDNGLDSGGYADLLKMVLENGLKGEALIPVAISYVLSEARYAGIREGLTEGMDSEVKKAVQKLNLATEIYQEIIQAIDKVPAVGKVKNAVEKSKILMKVKMIASRWSIDTGFIDKLKAQGKYVQLDVNELEKNPHMVDWLNRLTAEQQGAFIFKSGEQASAADFIKKHGVQGIDANDVENKGIARSNIITLLELGILDTSQDMPENSGLYLPYIYSVTGIYLAAQVILANGKFEDIEDNLVKTTLMATLGLSDPAELNALFKGKWPKLFRVSEIINELREAIRQTEIAA